ncbi:thioredoxin family protein [Flavivirga eckloniae]|uniref:Thioredoxin domain-containing protein n=1 Tax=Flavivirga eckloniae TaxID=1803846 RepID=A0A2K9PQ73_9FLAO|nr:thioredoxin family protein [Flavivirga eckloniae]AUP78717.1 hypothetical protein C1H87_08350 [Flavivirga eckloniae]
MKINRLLIGILLSLIYGSIKAQGIEFKVGDWEVVKTRAKAENKLIFVDVYTTWCGPCKKMDKYVFKDKKVGAFYNTNFISFKIDAEKEEGVDFTKIYEVNSYPSFLFIDNNGKQINRKTGALEREEFLKLGEKTLNSEKDFVSLMSAYNNGNREPEFILKYLSLLKGRGLPTEEIALWYFTMIEKENWTSLENLKLIKAYLNNPFSSVVGYLAKNKEPVRVQATLNSVYYTLFYVYKNYINTTISKRKNNKENDALLLSHISLNFYPNEADYLTFIAKRVIFSRDKNWKSYVEVVVGYVDSFKKPNALTLNECAYLFYKNNINDESALNIALSWINTALDITNKNHHNYCHYLDTKASILYKLGKKEEALLFAKRAIKKSKESGSDTNSTMDLIKKIENHS